MCGGRISGPLTSFSFELRNLPEARISAQRGPPGIDAQNCRGKQARDGEQMTNVLDGGFRLTHASLDQRAAALDFGSIVSILGNREKLHCALRLAQGIILPSKACVISRQDDVLKRVLAQPCLCFEQGKRDLVLSSCPGCIAESLVS